MGEFSCLIPGKLRCVDSVATLSYLALCHIAWLRSVNERESFNLSDQAFSPAKHILRWLGSPLTTWQGGCLHEEYVMKFILDSEGVAFRDDKP